MFYLIETPEQLSNLSSRGIKEAFMEIIYFNDNVHPMLNKMSLIYIRPFIDNKGYMLCISHSETLSLNITPINAFLKTIDRLYVRNKKQVLYNFQLRNLYDISLIKPIETEDTQAHKFIYAKHDHRKNVNLIIKSMDFNYLDSKKLSYSKIYF